MHFKLDPKRKNIVILGAGYCGIQTAKKLARLLKNNHEYEVVLIDRKSMHTYSADLYEIGTAYYDRVTNACLRDLKETVYIPLKIAFHGKELTFLQDTVGEINYEQRKVVLKKHGEVPFEYLVLALGSVTNFYGLPGVEENAFPLKTVEDALALDCHFEQVFRERWEKKLHTPVHIVIGGGGFTGVEYACELAGFVGKLQQKYHFERKEVEITVVQGGPQLVGLGDKVARLTERRFEKLGIQAKCNMHIKGYQNGKLELSGQDDKAIFLPADVLIWTAGVKPNPLLKSFPDLRPNGAIETLPTLECTHYPKIYAGGDNAAISDPKHGGFLPMLGQLAVQQGKAIGANIGADISKKAQKPYKPFFKGFIVPLGGKYAVYKGVFTFGGFIPWLMRRFIDLIYFASLMPFGKALKKWWHTENVFLQND